MSCYYSSTVPSPCISICTVNDNAICTGCYRSLEEISQWSTATDNQKRAILKRVEQRRNDVIDPPSANR